jgi:signal transduction histidine kinase
VQAQPAVVQVEVAVREGRDHRGILPPAGAQWAIRTELLKSVPPSPDAYGESQADDEEGCMAERAHRRRGLADTRAIDLRRASRDLASYAARLGGRLHTADDGLAVATLLTSAQRVAALVESRARREDGETPYAIVDLQVSLRRVLDVNRMAFTARGVALTTEPAPGVHARVDELGLDVTLSVLCCWAVLRAAPGSDVHVGIRALDGGPAVRFHLGNPAPEDGCIRIARSLASGFTSDLQVDEQRGIVELTLPPG